MASLMNSDESACASVQISNIGDAGSGDVSEQLGNIYKELCTWAKPTYGDTGTNWLNLALQAAAIAVALLNSNTQAQITDMQYELADAFADLSEDRWNRFKDNYAPFERKMMSEAGNLSDYDPDYDDGLSRADTNVTAAWLAADDFISDRAKKYALCMDSTLIDDVDYAESIALTDGANYNYRMEEYWHYYVADRNWNRRSEMLNIGRGIQAIASTYAQHANDALKSISELVNSGTAGAMRLFGYLGSLAETQYPAMFSAASPQTGASSDMLGSLISTGPTTLS